jgi:hypothetical protein
MIRLYRNNSARSSLKGCARPICCSATIPCCCRKARTPFAKLPRRALPNTTPSIDNSTDWQAIFALPGDEPVRQPQTLLLILPENGPNAAINEQLATLVGLLHDDLLLIVRGNKLTKAQENAAWLTALASARPGQLSDAGIGAAAALAGRAGQTASAAAGRRGQSAAVLLLRRQSAGAGAGAGASGAALAGR